MEGGIEEKIIISADKKFIETSYNGISVMVDENQYFNASKICLDNKVRFTNIKRCDYWKKAVDRVSRRFDLEPDQIVIQYSQDVYSNKVRGTYIHRKLLNCLCYHINEDYANKVDDLLDTINEINKLKAQKLEETVDHLKRKIGDLKDVGRDMVKKVVPVMSNSHLVYVLKLDNIGLPNFYKIVYDSSNSTKVIDNKIQLRGSDERFEIYKTLLVTGCKNFVDIFRHNYMSYKYTDQNGKTHRYLRVINKYEFEDIYEMYKKNMTELKNKFE